MGYHLRAETAAGPREEGRAPPDVRKPRAGVGSGYRYYSPELGRWVNRDPIGVRGGIGENLFLDNTSASSVDPLGLLRVDFSLDDPQPFDRMAYTQDIVEAGGLWPGAAAGADRPVLLRDWTVEFRACEVDPMNCVECWTASPDFFSVRGHARLLQPVPDCPVSSSIARAINEHEHRRMLAISRATQMLEEAERAIRDLRYAAATRHDCAAQLRTNVFRIQWAAREQWEEFNFHEQGEISRENQPANQVIGFEVIDGRRVIASFRYRRTHSVGTVRFEAPLGLEASSRCAH